MIEPGQESGKPETKLQYILISSLNMFWEQLDIYYPATAVVMGDPEPPKGLFRRYLFTFCITRMGQTLMSLSLQTCIYLVSVTAFKSRSLPLTFKCGFKVNKLTLAAIELI